MGHFLALTINASAQKVSQTDEENQSAERVPNAKTQREFKLLDNSRSLDDKEMHKLLEDTIVDMLSPTTASSGVQSDGIQMASLLSNYKDDNIFLQLMKLLTQSSSQKTREAIIKSIRVPYSQPVLIFLGKRLRDIKPTI